MFHLVFGGVLARFPKLKFVYVENEVAWLPFFVHEWDKYYKRFRTKMPLPFMEKLPGEYVTQDVLRKVVRENVIKLYNLKIDNVNN